MDNCARQQKLNELYCLIVELWNVEQTYDRARWRVAHYRKAKSADVANKKKIERARLQALAAQEQLAKTKARLYVPISELRQALFASLLHNTAGRICAIWMPDIVNRSYDGITVSEEQIRTAVDEYEANKALTEALEDKSES